MKSVIPKVSIGLPVYNGQQYIRFAIESLLSQSFSDFELIICDNASTDATQDICMEYIRRDIRVSYNRSEVNFGAAPNFNRAFKLSRGQYFKWAAYDDVCRSDFLLNCVKSLDMDDSIVLAYPRTTEIDESGREIRNFDQHLSLGAEKPSDRLKELLVGHSACYEVFGLIRSNILGGTKLIGPYIGSDRVLLAALALKGRFFEVSEYLFLRRNHSATSWDTMSKDPASLAKWFDTRADSRAPMATWRLLREYMKVIVSADISIGQKMSCLGILMKWLRINRRTMQDELLRASGLISKKTDSEPASNEC